MTIDKNITWFEYLKQLLKYFKERNFNTLNSLETELRVISKNNKFNLYYSIISLVETGFLDYKKLNYENYYCWFYWNDDKLKAKKNIFTPKLEDFEITFKTEFLFFLDKYQNYTSYIYFSNDLCSIQDHQDLELETGEGLFKEKLTINYNNYYEMQKKFYLNV